VRLLIAEPVLLNAPVIISVIVMTDEAIPGLKIYLPPSDPRVLVEGDRQWTLDTRALQNITVSSAWRFTQEGYYFILAQVADDRRGMVLGDSARIHIAVQVPYSLQCADTDHARPGTNNPPELRTSGSTHA
jgi:hypothetical protein